jgi:phosphoglucosamine mutase
MPKFPQILLNVRVAQRFDPMKSPEIVAIASTVERRFEGRGRIVLRASGTEPLIRVMVEGHDAKMVKAGAREIADVVEAVAGKGSAAPAGGPGLAVTGPRG